MMSERLTRGHLRFNYWRNCTISIVARTGLKCIGPMSCAMADTFVSITKRKSKSNFQVIFEYSSLTLLFNLYSFSSQRISLQEYYLGQYVPEKTTDEENEFDMNNPPKRKVDDLLLPYYPVRYVQGTICDITKKVCTSFIVISSRNQVLTRQYSAANYNCFVRVCGRGSKSDLFAVGSRFLRVWDCSAHGSLVQSSSIPARAESGKHSQLLPATGFPSQTDDFDSLGKRTSVGAETNGQKYHFGSQRRAVQAP